MYDGGAARHLAFLNFKSHVLEGVDPENGVSCDHFSDSLFERNGRLPSERFEFIIADNEVPFIWVFSDLCAMNVKIGDKFFDFFAEFSFA